MEKIYVTKTFLPEKKDFLAYIDQLWESRWLTNNGPLAVQLESEIKKYLNTPYLAFLNNGTIAIQIAIKALGLKGEIITTPFSYCATTTSILWENLTPIFVDINEHDFNINPDLIEEKITPNTTAILATHVYGNPCDTEKIEALAIKYNLKVIYDAAHAFGVNYLGKSLLSYGDLSTCSFHSTKVFHTVEGGAVFCHSQEMEDKIKLLRSFGHIQDDYYLAGINGKNSEFHAAMGLANLPYLESIISARKSVFDIYDNFLNWEKLKKVKSLAKDLEYNYAYYPVLFDSETDLDNAVLALKSKDIFPRRYFYPSLNQLPYLANYQACLVSESISSRVLSLPLYHDIDPKTVELIAIIINSSFE